jgi:hypothetical protein
MESFTIGLGNRSWFRAFGSNPLVRRSDRIEAMVVVFAVLLTVVAIPIACAIGTFVHEERTRLNADEARTRHQVVTTATEDGKVLVQGRNIVFTTQATWSDAGEVHSGVVTWPNVVKVGDRQSIWVNGQGELVGQRSPPNQADIDAVGAALSMWLVVAQASAGGVYLVRRWLDRSRYPNGTVKLTNLVTSTIGGTANHDANRTHIANTHRRESADVHTTNASRYRRRRRRFAGVKSRRRLGGPRSFITSSSADAHPRHCMGHDGDVARGACRPRSAVRKVPSPGVG